MVIYSLLGSMAFMGVIFLFVWLVMAISDRNSNIELNRGRQNYKVRYNPSNKKYYVTNASNYGDIDVCRAYFFRIYYKSKIDADMVMQKLNDPS